jgi:hypothetical protein
MDEKGKLEMAATLGMALLADERNRAILATLENNGLPSDYARERLLSVYETYNKVNRLSADEQAEIFARAGQLIAGMLMQVCGYHVK